jgi:hypothetical protein
MDSQQRLYGTPTEAVFNKSKGCMASQWRLDETLIKDVWKPRGKSAFLLTSAPISMRYLAIL